MINTNNFVYWLRICFATLALAGTLLLGPLVAPVAAQPIPAGCPGGALGPPAPGTVCPSGGSQGDSQIKFDNVEGTHSCGTGESRVKTGVDFGCRGGGNSIYDLLFAILRFLTIGVGIVAILSIIWGGIQYTTSQGDPKVSADAIKRIQSTVIAMVLYLMIYAIINWLVPGGFF